jgi:hypothetical protein
VAALAEKVSLLLDDANLRARFGAAGRAKVEREFNIAIEADRLCRIMTAALGGRVELLAPITNEVAEASEQRRNVARGVSDATDAPWQSTAPAGA